MKPSSSPESKARSMKLKGLFFLILLSTNAAAQSQTYTISRSVNIFGDSIITYKDQNRNNIREIKNSTDIFGNKIKSITGVNGAVIRSIKRSKDIFGNALIEITEGDGQSKTIKTSTDIFGDISKTIVDQNGRELLSVKESKDIFGDRTTTIKTDQNGDSLRSLLRLLQGRGFDDVL
jgi:hypothetical protein